MIQFSTDLVPVWVFRLAGRVGEKDVQAIGEFVDRMHQAERSVLLVDARQAGFPEPSIRKALGELTELRAPTGEDRTLAVSLLIEGGAISGAVRAILWFLPNTDLVKVGKNAEDALAHFEQRAPGLVVDELAVGVRAILTEPLVVQDDDGS